MLEVAKTKQIAEIDAKFQSRMKTEGKVLKIDAEDLYYKELNCLLRQAICTDAERIEIYNVCGQRYIGTDLATKIQIDIYGTPGNDLGAFMNGPKIVVHGNAQDGCGNTMNEGQIIVNGHAGDVTGNSMRGGKIFIRDYAGYRVGIHMKEYQRKIPQIVIGETAGDFLAEYMAGGVMLVLGLNLKEGEKCKARFVGTGMHAGIIYVRGEIGNLGKEVKAVDVNQADIEQIGSLVKEYCSHFNADPDKIMAGKFIKIVPYSHRPYGRIYAY